MEFKKLAVVYSAQKNVLDDCWGSSFKFVLITLERSTSAVCLEFGYRLLDTWPYDRLKLYRCVDQYSVAEDIDYTSSGVVSSPCGLECT